MRPQIPVIRTAPSRASASGFREAAGLRVRGGLGLDPGSGVDSSVAWAFASLRSATGASSLGASSGFGSGVDGLALGLRLRALARLRFEPLDD